MDGGGVGAVLKQDCAYEYQMTIKDCLPLQIDT